MLQREDWSVERWSKRRMRVVEKIALYQYPRIGKLHFHSHNFPFPQCFLHVSWRCEGPRWSHGIQLFSLQNWGTTLWRGYKAHFVGTELARRNIHVHVCVFTCFSRSYAVFILYIGKLILPPENRLFSLDACLMHDPWTPKTFPNHLRKPGYIRASSQPHHTMLYVDQIRQTETNDSFVKALTIRLTPSYPPPTHQTRTLPRHIPTRALKQ